MPTYATTDDLAAYPGGAAVSADDAPTLLARAERFMAANVFRFCWYQVGPDGMPSNTLVLGAFRDAVCAQVVYWSQLGDSTGAQFAGWGTVEIGSVTMSRSLTATKATDSPARQIAPEVGDVLGAPELTPDILMVGLVIT